MGKEKTTGFIFICFLSFFFLSNQGCQTPVKRAIRNLDDDRPSVRLSAVEQLGKSRDQRRLKYITRMLEDADSNVVLGAVAALRRVRDKRSAQLLISALKHKDPAVRYVVSKTLIAMSPDSVPPLIVALRHRSATTQKAAAEILGKIGDDRAVLPLINLLLDNVSNEVRVAVITALGRLGDARAVGPLIAVMKDTDSAGRYFVPDALVRIGRPAVQMLIELLQNEDPDVRELSLKALGKIGDVRAIPALIHQLKEKDPHIRRLSAEALATIGAGAVAPLIDEMRISDLNGVVSVAETLTMIGGPAVHPLIDEVKKKKSPLRGLSREILVKIGDSAVQPLIEEVKNKDSDIRYISTEALTQIGPPAVQALIDLLKEADSDTTRRCVTTLGKIGDKRAVKPLVDKMRDKDSAVRYLSAEALIRIGSPSVAPLFDEAVKKDSEIQQLSAQALPHIGLPAVPLLIEKMEVNDSEIQQAAMTLLTQIGGPAVSPLIQVMAEKDLMIRNKAADVLADIGSASVDPLIGSLTQNNPDLIWRAVLILGRIGDRRAADPLLAVLKGHRDSVVRYLAAEALGRIGDLRAIDPLIAELSDWHIRYRVAMALDDLGWRPETVTDRVHYLLAKRKKDGLISQWGDVERMLQKDLRSSNPRRIEYAVMAFIDQNETQGLKKLSAFLESDGDCLIAEIYLNSGQKKLAAAAEKWADQHGYQVYSPMDARGSVEPCPGSAQDTPVGLGLF